MKCPHCRLSSTAPARDRLPSAVGHVIHDYVQFYSCPECCGTWTRWQSDSPMFTLAEKWRLAFASGAS